MHVKFYVCVVPFPAESSRRTFWLTCTFTAILRNKGRIKKNMLLMSKARPLLVPENRMATR